jgi:hypothetical protein
MLGGGGGPIPVYFCENSFRQCLAWKMALANHLHRQKMVYPNKEISGGQARHLLLLSCPIPMHVAVDTEMRHMLVAVDTETAITKVKSKL